MTPSKTLKKKALLRPAQEMAWMALNLHTKTSSVRKMRRSKFCGPSFLRWEAPLQRKSQFLSLSDQLVCPQWIRSKRTKNISLKIPCLSKTTKQIMVPNILHTGRLFQPEIKAQSWVFLHLLNIQLAKQLYQLWCSLKL